MYEELVDKLRHCNLYGEEPLHWVGIICDAAEAIEKLQSELEHLKNCRHECKIDCLLKEYNKKCNELEQVKAEMGEAVRDMEAIMWVSGEGCQICKHCIEIHKEPYVQYACKIESRGCDPKWRGVQGGKDD